MGIILKGIVAAADEHAAEIVVNDLVYKSMQLPAGMTIEKGNTVIFAVFPDSTGIILNKYD